jgi:hydrogenase expression/formation protein HypE
MQLECPIPICDYPVVTLAHGGGGRLMRDLIGRMFAAAFAAERSPDEHDGAVLDVEPGRIAFTTDAFVVRPLFFPGADIGMLAVNGTANDLAMCGARPRHLACAYVIEEGLAMETLWRVVRSMRAAADAAGVRIVTGDTKVVDRGRGDGLYLATSGIGRVEAPAPVHPRAVRPGDAVIVSGDVGRHGVAVMAVREGLAFETEIASDCAPLWPAVEALLRAGIEVHCLRDLTRGGLASALNEIADSAGVRIEVDEAAVPVREDVRGACEMLGLDPLYVANEGRFAAFVPAAQAAAAVAVLRAVGVASGAAIVGAVDDREPGLVTLRSVVGATRILDLLSGEQLPRIC